MRGFILLTFSLLTTLQVNAQTWTKTQGPYGGSIRDIIVHPTNGTVYALGTNNNQTIFRSTDNGNNWTEHSPSVMGSDLGRIADLKVFSDGSIFALANNNLYKTLDDGTTWTKVNTGTSSSSNGFDQGSEFSKNVLSGTMYVMGYHYNDGLYTVFRSTNNGATWTKGYQGQYFYQFVSTATGDVYAINSGQLWKSANDGSTFAVVASPADVAAGVTSLVSKSNGTQLFLSTTSSSSNVYSLVSPFTTWTAVAETGIAAADIGNYAANSVLLVSADNTTLFLFDNQNNKTYSRTSGAWAPLSTTFVTTNGEDNLCAASKDNSTLYVGTNSIGVWKSINGGIGWSEVNVGIENINMRNLVVGDDGSITVAGDNIVFRSTDAGQSWSKTTGISASSSYDIIKAATGTPKTLVLLAQSGGASYKSINSGSSWSPITATPSGANYFSSPDGTKILAYNSSQLFYSSNQGTLWSAALTITGLPTSYSFYHVAMDQNAIVYAFVYDYTASSYKFYKIAPNNTTTPTSAIATQISLATIGVTYVNDIKFLNNKIYVLGYASNDILSITSNAGTSWTPKTIAGSFRLDVDPINNYLFLTRSNGGSYTIYLSRDDGDNFVTSTISLNSNKSSPYGIGLNSSGNAYAGFSGSSVFKTSGTVVIPVAPSSLVNSGSMYDRITLQFTDNAANEDYFLVEKFNGSSYDSVGNTSSIFNTGQKGYVTVKGLQANTSYQFRVSAVNSAGHSTYVPITAGTFTNCSPVFPDNKSWNGNVNGATTLTNIGIKSLGNGLYSISDINNSTVTTSGTAVFPATFGLSCNGVTNATYLYDNYPYQPNGNGTWNSTTNTLVLKWITDSGVTPQVVGTVTLVKAATDPTPAAPTSASAYVYDNTSIEISWLGSFFETSYVVERSTSNTFATIDRTIPVPYPSTPTTIVSVVDGVGLTAPIQYYYRVKASNATGTSAPSNTTTVTFTKPNFVLANTTLFSTAGSYTTTGVIWGDFNNDGFEDAVLPQLTFSDGTPATPLLYRNTGTGDFTAVASSGIENSLYLTGSAGDYDNDGNLDLFFTASGAQNYLYKGNGNFTFTKVLSTPVSENSPNDNNNLDLGAAWSDYNKDGLLDLVVVPSSNTKPVKLFVQSPAGTFTKITTGDLATAVLRGSVALWADYDNDGDADVFLNNNNSAQANHLYKNNGDGTFTQVTGAPFDTDVNLRVFTGAWGDYNNDGFLDLYLAGENANVLYKNNGNGTFTNQALLPVTETKPANTESYGIIWADINNDGFLDIITTNAGSGAAAENIIYINNNGTAFTKRTSEKISDSKVSNFGAAVADYNGDGFLDIGIGGIDPIVFGGNGVAQQNTKSYLFKNNNTTGNWSEIKLRGVTSNRAAIGARITLTAGGKTQIRELTTTTSFAGQNSLTAHFGLGATATITNIQIKWPSGIIQNYANPPINQILTIVEDNQGPSISTRTPAVAANNVNSNTTIDIILNEASTAVASKNLILSVAGSATPTATLAVTSAVKTGTSQFTFTLPAKLLANTDYTIAINAGAFTDIYGNSSAAVAATAWTFKTSPGPSVTALLPAHNATAVAVASALEITFNSNVTAVAGKKIKVMDGATAVVDLDVSTNGTIATTKYSLPAPAGSWPFAKTLKVVVDPGAFVDAGQNDFAGIALDSWNFTTVDAADVTPPVVTLLPVPQLAKGFSNKIREATVTDNKGVSTVVVSIRKITGTTYTDLNAIRGTGADIDKWAVVFSEANHFDAIGTEFFITAKDINNNTTRMPAGTDTYKMYLNYSEADAKIPATNLGVGGKKTNWKVFSIPFDLGTNNSVQSVFDELTAATPALTNKIDYRLITYKDQTSWSEFPEGLSVFERGKGYFINIKKALSKDISVGADLAAPSNSRSNLFQISLKQGWNMIGNPYLTAISWDDVAAYNSLTGTAAQLKKFSEGIYSNNQSVAPFEGGFVFLDAAKNITIPFLGQITAGGRKGERELNPNIDDENWAVNMKLSQGEFIYDLSAVGMATDASASFDDYDDVTPPRFFDYLEVNFGHPEHFARRFTKDVVPTQSSYTWEFTVNSNLDGQAGLSWNNAALSSARKDIFLLDVGRDKLINMKEVGSYSFDPKESATFRVYFGENLKIAPEHIHLGKAYPNPTSGYTTIGFSLPESGGLSQNVTLDIMDAMGRNAGTIVQGMLAPGYHETGLDAKQLNNGFYTYRLTVKGLHGTTTQVNKLIIK
jgi:hypothetical protein